MTMSSYAPIYQTTRTNFPFSSQSYNFFEDRTLIYRRPSRRGMEIQEKYEVDELDSHYRWRSEAKMVAYITWCLGWCYLTLIGMAACVWTFLAIRMKRGYLSQDFQDMLPGLEPDTENLYFSVGFASLIVAAMMTGVKIWAANSLICGMTTIKEAHETRKRCIIWRNVNLFLLLLAVVMVLGKGYYNQWYAWLWINLHVICIGIVWMHIKELKRESQKLLQTKEKYASTAENILNEPA